MTDHGDRASSSHVWSPLHGPSARLAPSQGSPLGRLLTIVLCALLLGALAALPVLGGPGTRPCPVPNAYIMLALGQRGREGNLRAPEPLSLEWWAGLAGQSPDLGSPNSQQGLAGRAQHGGFPRVLCEASDSPALARAHLLPLVSLTARLQNHRAEQGRAPGGQCHWGPT